MKTLSKKESLNLGKIKRWQPEPTENYINVTLANGASEQHSTTFKKYFISVGNGQYKIKPQYKGNDSLTSSVVRNIRLKTNGIKTIAQNYMKDSNHIFSAIDRIIETIDKYRQEPIFGEELRRRENNIVPETLTENKIFETFTKLIAYSQNAKSDVVEKIIKSGIFNEVFSNFDIVQVSQMNPCDLADKYWSKISGIRQQAKLFHIVSLSRKIKRIVSFSRILTDVEIPKQIKSEEDIDKFWKGFERLLKSLKTNKIPFFSSTTSLLHFLLDIGYDCVKPDLVVMKVSRKLGIVDSEKGNNNLVQTVKTIQQYSIRTKRRPSIVDFYFLIDEGQLGAKKYVTPQFYNNKA